MSRARGVAGRERNAGQLPPSGGCFHVLFFQCQLVDVSTRPWHVITILKVCSSEGLFRILGLTLAASFVVASGNIDAVDLCVSM